MDHRTTEQLILDREITQLAIRIDRLHTPRNRSILASRIERLIICEALTYAVRT
jgi:hypothetical protein